MDCVRKRFTHAECALLKRTKEVEHISIDADLEEGLSIPLEFPTETDEPYSCHGPIFDGGSERSGGDVCPPSQASSLLR